jgi:signal recognition particle subunit SEC65
MSDLFPATLAEMAREAEREVALRRRVYPRWVAEGRMKQHHAERQIALMEAIAAELQRRERAE